MKRAARTAHSARSTRDDSDLKVYLLDVGSEQYGDCVLCVLGDRTILVDGAHPGDFRGRSGYPSIPAQLEQILGHKPRFHIDLLVATHCHLDHIGCLPDLVVNDLDVEWALMVDEALGFPPASDASGDSSHPAYRLTSALLEENRAESLDDQELQQFLQDAANLQSRYTTMLQSLEQGGKLVRWRGNSSDADSLVAAFADFGLEILGPNQQQLEVCADYLRSAARDAADQLADVADDLDLGSEVAIYRSKARKWSTAWADVQDRAGPGAARNNQSIVLKLEVGGYKALLTGDMQFASPEIPGLDELMPQLLQKVNEAGPYGFVKLAHHGSYNGLDETILSDWKATPTFACSNGTNDTSHPNPDVLKLLDEQRARLEWARTDRNGLVTVAFSGSSPALIPTRGELNDATPNTSARPRRSGRDISTELIGSEGLQIERTTTDAGEVTATAKIGNSSLTISLKVPRETPPAARASLPVQSQKDLKQPRLSTVRPPDAGLASGRELPQLLFVTYAPKLRENIGQQEARDAVDTIRRRGQTVLEVQNQANPFVEIQKEVATGKYKGVVVLGGYDVLPSQRLDVLDPGLRAELGSDTHSDADNFVVWSDVTYGDIDGDGLAELPVSRIPDAKSSRLVYAALRAGVRESTKRFGVRNYARPFADPVYNLVPGVDKLLVSELTTPGAIGARSASGSALYFMLHGADWDGTRFWGESAGGGTLEAFNISNVADSCPGVVFTGCCWGALTVQQLASRSADGQILAPRPVEGSIALSFLQAGAVAFVGCTGSHYSPTKSPYDFFGGPMHTAFWKSYNGNRQPAAALFLAKEEYLKNIPHGQRSSLSRAIELKILREYTCLGLGW